MLDQLKLIKIHTTFTWGKYISPLKSFDTMLRANCRVLGKTRHKMADETAFFASWINTFSLLSSASILPLLSFKPLFKRGRLDISRWERGFNTLCPPSLLWTKAASILRFDTPLGWIWIVWLYSWIAFVRHYFSNWKQWTRWYYKHVGILGWVHNIVLITKNIPF